MDSWVEEGRAYCRIPMSILRGAFGLGFRVGDIEDVAGVDSFLAFTRAQTS